MMSAHRFAGQLVAGVDEVGRGPLAGDVVAAAVILGDVIPAGITDSKKLSEPRRRRLASELQGTVCAWALGRASVAEIDQLNILHASLLAMHRAVDALTTTPDVVLVDGNRVPNWSYESYAVVGGDAIEPCIGAASILAKVTRDAEMVALETTLPGYGFASHKGYPTRQHMDALERLGVSEAHRRSFGPVARLLNSDDLG